MEKQIKLYAMNEDIDYGYIDCSYLLRASQTAAQGKMHQSLSAFAPVGASIAIRRTMEKKIEQSRLEQSWRYFAFLYIVMRAFFVKYVGGLRPGFTKFGREQVPVRSLIAVWLKLVAKLRFISAYVKGLFWLKERNVLLCELSFTNDIELAYTAYKSTVRIKHLRAELKKHADLFAEETRIRTSLLLEIIEAKALRLLTMRRGRQLAIAVGEQVFINRLDLFDPVRCCFGKEGIDV